MYREWYTHRMWKCSLLQDAILWAWLQRITLLMLMVLLNVQAISVYLCTHLWMHLCACLHFSSKRQRIGNKLNRYSRNQMYACPQTSRRLTSFLSFSVHYIHHTSMAAVPTLFFSGPVKEDWLKRIRHSQEDVCISCTHITSLQRWWAFHWLSLPSRLLILNYGQ